MLLTVSILLLMPFMAGSNFSEGAEYPNISTEKEAYAAGETITVFGTVDTSPYDDSQVLLRIISPVGNLVTIEQVDIDSANNFSVDIPTSISGVWKNSGTYIIIANYWDTTFQTQFDYGGMMSAGVKSGETGGEFESGNLNFGPVDEFSESASMIQLEDYALLYEITGAKILKIVPDVENNSLIITIETFNDGELRITLPKEVIDTTEGSFFVLVDGEETNHDANSTTGFWTLVIPFYNGSEEIEIIGTFVIP